MTEPSGADIQAAFCRVICDEWVRAGVTDAVVAPGSRSTPLVAALDAEPGMRVTVVLDERAAGFVALGMSLASGRPAVVATTSGTASVELHPAVVEAGQAGVPLIAVTTDRPPELHRVGAPQTVEQVGLFGPAVRFAADPGVADRASARMWRSLASRCVAEAMSGRGPVHLNLPFREPLLGDADRVTLPAGRAGGRPWHQALPGPPAQDPGPLAELLRSHSGNRGLVVAGEGAAADDGEAGALIDLVSRLGWPLLAEPRSGCRWPAAGVVAAADSILRSGSFAALAPDVVVRIGPPPASKVVNQWLAGLGPEVPQILVDRFGRWADPDRSAAHHVTATTSALVAAADQPVGGVDREWARRWQAAEEAAQSALGSLLAPGGRLELSEPAVARACLAAVPGGGTLFASSSMPVRDVEWFGAGRRDVRVLANRGANGIDGVLATATGVALGSARPTVALLGDLAFLYDAGSLLWAGRRDVRLSVVVVDNDGGGIFSFLPQAAALPAERFEAYWGTPHGLDLVAVARAYGVEAAGVGSRAELDRFLAAAGSPGVRVAVVASGRAANVAAHEEINRAVAEAIAGL